MGGFFKGWDLGIEDAGCNNVMYMFKSCSLMMQH